MTRFIFFLVFFFPACLHANNVQVSNVSLTDQDTDLNTIMINFDLSWENSWRISAGPSNWDAAWVFVKYKTLTGAWRHLEINFIDGDNDGHVEPTGANIKTVEDGIGCFIYRDADGSGHNNFNNVKLLWDYGLEGLDDDAAIEIKVFAIEMVYVPSSPFSVGIGESGSEANQFYSPSFSGDEPFLISSEDEIIVQFFFGALYYDSGGGDQSGPIPAEFPKGFDAFYCMKYEISQGQWVAFFNTLTSTQKSNNDITDVNHKGDDGILFRNAVAWTSGFATTVHPDIPMTYYNWSEMTAYLDWAGLRPMTELEYEKACRGPRTPFPGEFPWGNTDIPQDNGSLYTLINSGTPFELISNPQEELAGVSFVYSTGGAGGVINGPLRCGIHATSAINKTRTETGGSYYGIMELAGNVSERCITIGSSDSRGFTGLHGDGELNTSGENNVSNWPLGNTGRISRGGAFESEPPSLRVSDRISFFMSEAASPSIGTRGVRTE
jgi:formylglycine-generating enzyme required for sulfatase activity